ncbi:MAG: Holliday junction resolvase RuvX, partial [Fidelibacterota bacterium]
MGRKLQKGRVMGIDYGTRRIGIALSDRFHLIARGYCTLTNRGLKRVLDEIGEIVRRNDVT